MVKQITNKPLIGQLASGLISNAVNVTSSYQFCFRERTIRYTKAETRNILPNIRDKINLHKYAIVVIIKIQFKRYKN